MDIFIQITVFCPPSLELVPLFTGTRERSIVKYMKKNLDITKPCYNEQNVVSPLALRYIEVPL